MPKYSKLIIISEREPAQHLSLLAQSVGIKTLQIPKTELLQQELCRHSILALPCHGKNLAQRSLLQDIQHLHTKAPLFLFQAEKNMLDLTRALQLGLRGAIFRDDPLDKVMTALKVLLQGELYYPRAILSSVVDEMFGHGLARHEVTHAIQSATILTRQERKIIQLVAEGARNKEIAEHLNISAHTVKAHLSTIFRKTQARNRVELLRWFQQNNQQPTPQPIARLA